MRLRSASLRHRAAALGHQLDRIDERGDLSLFSIDDLEGAIDEVNRNLQEAYTLYLVHDEQAPSWIWFGISASSGFGGLFLLEPMTAVATASLIVTIGGAMGAAKSVYDKGVHLVEQQAVLAFYWRAHRQKDAIAAELTRRGIRF